MADTNTANIGLLIADLNDTFNFGAHVEANFTTIDGLMGAVQCTSGSRPTNTYAGQIIYETDSKRYAQNTGTKAVPAWTYMSHQAYAAASSARPTVGLTAGQLLYETDNLAVRTRGAAAWNGFLAVATSTALPANPIAGDFAYLSDKDAVVRWTGSAWKLTSTVVCTSSSRPTLSIAAGTTIYETDSTRLLVYNGSAWEQKAFANFVCTSSTHPASPYTGLEIFETDTGQSAVYNGTNYLYGAQQLAPTQTLGTTTASVTFSSLPAVTHLTLIWHARGDTAAGTVNLQVQVNSVSTANQITERNEASTATVSGVNNTAQSSLQIGAIPGNTATALYFGAGSMECPGWNDTTNYTPVVGTGTSFPGGAAGFAGVYGGISPTAGTNTSLKVSPNAGNFVTGSRFSVYGRM